MNTDDIRKELSTKERYLSDLNRYIITRTDNNPNYCLLLGSGCSVSSGIKTGKNLIEEWRKEVYLSLVKKETDAYDENTAIEFLTKSCGSWYNVSNEYSSLFEKKYDLPRQRRMFVEQQVNGIMPSLGYAYLANLVRETYFNTIFTTNFDDLLNESFYQFTSERPIVCAHDSSITSITVSSKRPKIIKLHGDYLFDDIKSTLRETESLEENTRNKLIEFSKDYGLIVVGYSGNDRSVMDVLNYLLKQDDYLKNGIYWCIREGDEISEELRKLLWRDRVYFVVIEGFDEFFAWTYKQIFGDKVPVDTGFISSKSQDIVKRFLTNESLLNSKSKEIKSDIDKLKKLSESHNFYNILRETKNLEYIDSDDENFTDEETLFLFNVKEKINKELYDEVVSTINKELSSSKNSKYKIKLYDYLIDSYVMMGELENAINAYDMLISIDDKNPVHLLNKSKITSNFKEKMELIDLALEKDAYFYATYFEKAHLLEQQYNCDIVNGSYDEIVDNYMMSVLRYPSIRNASYSKVFEFVLDSRVVKDKKIDFMKDIIKRLSEQNPLSSKTLYMKFKLLEIEDKENDTKANMLDEVKTAKVNGPESNYINYDMLYLKMLNRLNKKADIISFLEELSIKNKYENKVSFLLLKAKLFAEKLDDIDDAIRSLEKALRIDKDPDIINKLITYKIYNKDFVSADEYIEKYKNYIGIYQCLAHKRDLHEERGEFKKALATYQQLIKESLFKEHHKPHLAYIYILIAEYEEARRLCKEYLESINYNVYADTAIVNYELSKTLMDGKGNVSKKRLSDVFTASNSSATKAAVKALLNEPNEAFKYIHEILEENKTMKYQIIKWPVFFSLHKDERWKKLFG